MATLLQRNSGFLIIICITQVLLFCFLQTFNLDSTNGHSHPEIKNYEFLLHNIANSSHIFGIRKKAGNGNTYQLLEKNEDEYKNLVHNGVKSVDLDESLGLHKSLRQLSSDDTESIVYSKGSNARHGSNSNKAEILLDKLKINKFEGSSNWVNLDLSTHNASTSNQSNVNTEGYTTGSVPMHTVGLEEYIQFYNLRTDQIVCTDIYRPSLQDIHWDHNQVYQAFTWTDTKVSDPRWKVDVYLLNVYYDDRFIATEKARFFRTVVTIKGPGHDDKETNQWKRIFTSRARNRPTIHMQLWYSGFKHPLTTSCYIQDAGALVGNIDPVREASEGTFYFSYVVTCEVPEVAMLPVNASLVSSACDKPTTYKPIVYPAPPRHPAARDIGLCMASLYGSLSRYDVPHLVSWFEALRLFGILEVTMNNASCVLKDEMVKKAFDYYQKSGFLKLTHYPPVEPPPWRDQDFATETINKLTTSDCFFRNMHRYWFVLIHDLDELVVPAPPHRTYTSFLEDYDRKHHNLSSTHCVSVRSAFFYRGFGEGNPEFGEHLPLHRYTQRWNAEPLGDRSQGGVGMSKSFSNMRHLVAAGHHMCWQSHTPWEKLNQAYLPADTILLHHYRNSTKFSERYAREWNRTVVDRTLLDLHRAELKQRAENVLRVIGYM